MPRGAILGGALSPLRGPSAPLVVVCLVLSIICLSLFAFILYVFCSKKYKLNWYERNLLEVSKQEGLSKELSTPLDKEECSVETVVEVGVDVEKGQREEDGEKGEIRQPRSQHEAITKLKSLRQKSLSSLGGAISSWIPSMHGSEVRKSTSTPEQGAATDSPDIASSSSSSPFGETEMTSWGQACLEAKRAANERQDSAPQTSAIQAPCPKTTALAKDVTDQFWVPDQFMRQESDTSIKSKPTVGGKSLDSPEDEKCEILDSIATDDTTGNGSMISEETLGAGGSFHTEASSATNSEKPQTTSDVICSHQVARKAISLGVKDETGKIDPSMYKSNRDANGGIEEINVGSIHLILRFDSEYNLLTVRIVQAQGLVPRDFSGTASPYCRVALLPGGRPRLQSRVQRATVDPVFEEDFVFDVPPADLQTKTVEILIYDYDQYSRDECIGQAFLPLGGVDLSAKIDMWKAVSPFDKGASAEKQKQVKGDLMFSLAYLQSAERLTVVVMKARNLKPIYEEKKTADPYVKVSLSYAGKRLKKKKTSTKTNLLNPTFNEALVFQLGKEFLPNICLEVAVIDNALLGQKQVIGKIELGPDTVGEEREHWQDMVNAKNAVARWHAIY